jgi:hypothetical protein
VGTQITKRFSFLVATLMLLSCSFPRTSINKEEAINTDNLGKEGARIVSEKEVAEAKGLALCDCFIIMSKKMDSLSIIGKNDASASYFVQMSTLGLGIIVHIGNFVKQNIDSFIGVPYDGEKHGKEHGKLHMIGYTCWQLYISDELDAFVKNILKNEQFWELK